MQLKKGSFYEYGPFQLDPAEHLLTREGIPESLAPKANLTVSIAVLRRILGEKEGGLRYIETVPKKGYRFIASVREVKGALAVMGEAESSSETTISA